MEIGEILKDFFSNTFFTIVVGISALVMTTIYFLSFSKQISEGLRRKRMDKRISKLKDHYIVCGLGRVGQQVAEELSLDKKPFVVIERNAERANALEDQGWLIISGDAAKDEEILKKAGIQNAKGIIIAVGDDADSVYIAVSAKSLNHSIYIVARASSKEAEDKLLKLGVDRVSMPYKIGGYHMATMATRPSVIDFLDVVVDSQRTEIQVEEVLADEKNGFASRTLEDIFQNDLSSLAVLAIRKTDGSSLINPQKDIQLQNGETMLVMGTKEQLEKLAG